MFLCSFLLYIVSFIYLFFSDSLKSNNPPTPPSTPMDNLLLETPIQFDLFSPAEDKERSKSKDSTEVLVISLMSFVN